MGNVRFGAPKKLVLWMRDSFKTKVFFETGTNRAETAVWASENFAQVYTVEGYEPLYRRAVETFANRKNIHFLHGDSRGHMKSLVGSLTEPAIFWLDAHWCGEETFGKADECPVVGEVEVLNETKVPHIVMIDDARLFLSPPPAPHVASHWPNISEVCQLLARHDSDRYVAVFDDVIIGMPKSGKPQLVEFLRSEAAQTLSLLPSSGATPKPASHSKPKAKTFLRRLRAKL